MKPDSSFENSIVVDGSAYALTESGLTAVISAAADGDTIDVRGNINLDSTVTVTKNLSIKSSKDGSLIRDSGFTSGYLLTVLTGKTLTLKNITLNGNNIASNSAIYLSDANLILEGGAVIKNNHAGTNNGGGIRINSGTVTLNGGTITGNTANFGGGIFIESGTCTMSGGTISDNTAASSGGGVYTKGFLP